LPQAAQFFDHDTSAGNFVWAVDFEAAGEYEAVLVASDGQLTAEASVAFRHY
jgi:hypothetical protein